MSKRIIYLSVGVAIVVISGLVIVQRFFSSFPRPETVIERIDPSEDTLATIELTESFFDDSGSMAGYHSSQFIRFLRLVKSHIREKGRYNYYAFSDPDRIIEDNAWDVIERSDFYSQNNTYFDNVLDSILRRVRSGDRTARNFLIITDGIQDVSNIQDYSRIVNKVSDLLDMGMFFQIVAVKLPFSGNKYPEKGGAIGYKGDSPLFCYIFTYQYDYGRDLFKRLGELDIPVKFLGFGNRNIEAIIEQFKDPGKNRDGSGNAFKRFKDAIPLTYLISRSGTGGTGGTLLMKVALNLMDINLDINGLKKRIPEFCGSCLPIEEIGDTEQEISKSRPDVTVLHAKVDPLSDAQGKWAIEYSLFFKNWDKKSKTVACDLTLCDWLPVNPPDWVDAWSSDCDDNRGCFEGKTPFLSEIITPVLNKSIREYTFGYTLIRN